MRKMSWIFTILLVVGVETAEAQAGSDIWEVSGSAGLLENRPSGSSSQSRDDWYSEGRFALTVGRYWTEHLKTEVEVATSGEGSTYEYLSANHFESLHRLDQLAARIVWQFGSNQWVHPYISSGVVADRARRRDRHPAQYQFPSGRTTGPMILVPESVTEPTVDYQVGFSAGAGAKFYVSPNAFFNAGAITTCSRAAATISLLAGFGIDF